MEKEVRLREWLFIGKGALIGAMVLTIVTLVFWKPLDVDPNAHIDFGIMGFTIPKGALLGGATAYLIQLLQAKQDELAAKVALGVGGAVMLVFVSRLDNVRSSLQWDGFTALWGLVMLLAGATAFFKIRRAKAAEEKVQE